MQLVIRSIILGIFFSINQVNNRFDLIQEDLTSVKSDVAVLKTDVAVLKNDVNSINTRVGFLEKLNPLWFLVKEN